MKCCCSEVLWGSASGKGSFHPTVRFASSSLLLVPPTPTVLFCVVFFLSFAVLPPAHIYRDALQLSGEGGVQSLWRDLQPVGDVGRGPEHLLEGPGLFPESGKEDKKGNNNAGGDRKCVGFLLQSGRFKFQFWPNCKIKSADFLFYFAALC